MNSGEGSIVSIGKGEKDNWWRDAGSRTSFKTSLTDTNLSALLTSLPPLIMALASTTATEIPLLELQQPNTRLEISSGGSAAGFFRKTALQELACSCWTGAGGEGGAAAASSMEIGRRMRVSASTGGSRVFGLDLTVRNKRIWIQTRPSSIYDH